jgi:hypothetical protein
MNGEKIRIWKVMVMAYLKVLAEIRDKVFET